MTEPKTVAGRLLRRIQERHAEQLARKIFRVLLDSPAPLTAQEIVEKARLPMTDFCARIMAMSLAYGVQRGGLRKLDGPEPRWQRTGKTEL